MNRHRKHLMVAGSLALALGSLMPMATQARGVNDAAVSASSFVLCAPAGTPPAQMAKIKVIVSRRVRNGFHFKAAIVKRTSSRCVTVTLTHTLKWIRWLAADVSSVGRFGIGVTYPKARQQLSSGQYVRYKNDPLTSANAKLPVVKVAIGRPGFIGWTAKLVRRQGYDYVGVKLTPGGSRTLCTFTSRNVGGLAVVILDRQVITDEQVTVKICGGRLLTGFPLAGSRDKPLGPRELLADLHSGTPLPVALSLTSMS